jgi:hypothetical protein
MQLTFVTNDAVKILSAVFCEEKVLLLREIRMGGVESGGAIYFANVHAPPTLPLAIWYIGLICTPPNCLRRQKYRGTTVAFSLTPSVHVLQ